MDIDVNTFLEEYFDKTGDIAIFENDFTGDLLFSGVASDIKEDIGIRIVKKLLWPDGSNILYVCVLPKW